ncbi:MAG TPA: hypothetical protein VF412_12390 [Bdellovibrio sp.]|uniref:hypothetical protein n=1 Tax=Bdellovibrio sp. TaxID=28201 RepID=UPI002F14FDB8
MKKGLLIFALVLQAIAVKAADTIPFTFQNEELSKVIEAYSKASGQKFILDPGVRGRVTILMPEKISVEEAFNQLSSALAVNGFAISKQGDTMVIMTARNIQRNLLEVTTQVPALKPERMVSYIYTPKYLTVDVLNRDLRILPSRDGEMNSFMPKNQLIINDWSSNVNRVAQLLAELDKPNSPETQKLVDMMKKNSEARHAQKVKEEKAQK